MSLTDPIADMLTRIRNAVRAKKKRVDVPTSRMSTELARLLLREKYVSNMKSLETGPHPMLRIYLKYTPDEESVLCGLTRVSRPGRRVYVGVDKLPRVQGGLGTAVLSTPCGILTDKECRRANVGGEVVGYVR
jgi:small subunit ribosomal protein S8